MSLTLWSFYFSSRYNGNCSFKYSNVPGIPVKPWPVAFSWKSEEKKPPTPPPIIDMINGLPKRRVTPQRPRVQWSLKLLIRLRDMQSVLVSVTQPWSRPLKLLQLGRCCHKSRADLTCSNLFRPTYWSLTNSRYDGSLRYPRVAQSYHRSNRRSQKAKRARIQWHLKHRLQLHGRSNRW